MVSLRQATAGARQYIQGYGSSGFRISGVSYQGAVLVCPNATLPLPISRIEELNVAHLEVLATGERPTEVLLVGCGKSMTMLPNELVRGLGLAGIGVEAMDSGAAARTYNVLVVEDRRVAAVLMPVA